MNAQRNLATTQNQQATTFERLSTGLRVNSAKDDAGGLYLAQAQTKDITGLGMATRNAGDGISMAQTAEGALDQIGQNLQRINELAIQSANGTYSAEARGGLQKEVDELTQEINRIVETTEFNGQKLLSSDAKSETLQIGFQNNSASRITTGLEGGIAGLDGLENVTFFGADRDYQNVEVAADGTTKNGVVQADWALSLGMTGTNLEAAAPADRDLAGLELGDDLGKALANALGDLQGDADDLQEALVAIGGTSTTVTADGVDFTLTFDAAGEVSEVKADANGTTFFVEVDDLEEEDFRGTVDLSGLDVGSTAAAADPNDIAIAVSDSNALNAIVSDGLNQTKSVNISTQADAQNAITATRNAIDMVSELRAEFGANQNRFEAVISGNQTYSENLSAARSRIQDADFAVETANLAKQQVLQQAGISALGQANASSQAILGLL